jgi:sialate O-acetylesterase
MPHRVGLQLRGARRCVSGAGHGRRLQRRGLAFRAPRAGRPGIPIGILNLSWGGTHVETWTSPRAAATDPDTVRAMPADADAFVQGRRDRLLERVRRFQGASPSTSPAPTRAWTTAPGPR